jgi:hypothetical protein
VEHTEDRQAGGEFFGVKAPIGVEPPLVSWMELA